jgi:hypothetical protein
MARGPAGGPRPFVSAPVAVVTRTEEEITMDQFEAVDEFVNRSFRKGRGRKVAVEEIKDGEGVAVVISFGPTMLGVNRGSIPSLLSKAISVDESIITDHVPTDRIDQIEDGVKDAIEENSGEVVSQELRIG